ncbi:hypothetical protein GCM10010439_24640 [Actinocorallia aurantiaca]|uniref:Uncharacterized protein n=1 Tax=Actinocorallia aurantiaca TaxID=46204 RepID=A0ABN3U6X3_9ACTN
MRAEVGGVNSGQAALPASDGGTDRADDVRLGHNASKDLGVGSVPLNRMGFGQYELTRRYVATQE